jgi:hypothetical protein
MVGALMELLPEGAGGALPRLAPGPRRQWKWTGMAVALAAGLALAVYLMPARHAREEAIVLPALARAAEIEAGAAAIPATPAVAETPVAHRPRRARVSRQTVEEPEHFVALDDEPFEAGVIMRVDVKPGNVQADIVFGPDGRAHAFRLVNATQRDY